MTVRVVINVQPEEDAVRPLARWSHVSDAELASWQLHLDHARALSVLAAEASRAAGRRLAVDA